MSLYCLLFITCLEDSMHDYLECISKIIGHDPFVHECYMSLPNMDILEHN